MALVRAKCERCGASLEVDNTLKASICPHCGSAYVVQDAINHYQYGTNTDNPYAGVVNMVDENSSQARIAAADAYMRVRDYKRAEEEHTRVIQIAPQNYIGWWGYIRAYTREFTLSLNYKSQFDTLVTYYNSVFTFAPEEVRTELYDDWCAYYNQQLENYNKRWSVLKRYVAQYQTEVDRLKREMDTAKENADSCYSQAMKTKPKAKAGSSWKYKCTQNLCIISIITILFGGVAALGVFSLNSMTVATNQERLNCWLVVVACVLIESVAIVITICKHAKFNKLCRRGQAYNEEKIICEKRLNQKRLEMIRYEREVVTMKS